MNISKFLLVSILVFSSHWLHSMKMKDKITEDRLDKVEEGISAIVNYLADELRTIKTIKRRQAAIEKQLEKNVDVDIKSLWSALNALTKNQKTLKQLITSFTPLTANAQTKHRRRMTT